MAIGNCDCCDRINVPGSVVTCPGEPFACFICQGDDEVDPYCEMEEPCSQCGGDGSFDAWSHDVTCTACDGTGTYTAEVRLITLDDLEDIGAAA
jgi:DnaJ-class molecular chaperone